MVLYLLGLKTTVSTIGCHLKINEVAVFKEKKNIS